MAITAKELKRKAGQLAKQQQDILDQATEKMTPDQEKQFDQLHKEETELIRQAQMIENRAKAEYEAAEAEEIEQPKLKKVEDLKPEERQRAEDLAMRQYLRKGTVSQELHSIMAPSKAENDDKDHIDKALKDMGLVRATQTTTTTGGGYTIPRGFQAELEKAIKAYGGMWESSRIIKTTSGNVIDWPTVNDTANKAYLLAESVSAATSAVAVTFGQQQFEAYKYTSGLIQVPAELLEDAEFDIGSELISMLSERIWRGTNEAFTTADGSSKPKGITAGAVYGGSTADDAALSSDDFLELEHSVDPGYRNRPGTGWMFHDSVLLELKKLSTTSTDKRPLWLPSIREGEPSTLFGYKYTINQDMAAWTPASTTANDNDKTILFGDMQKYIIRQVRNMRIVRLNERYGELDQVAFVVFFRVDGDLLNGGTNPVKYLRTSAT